MNVAPTQLHASYQAKGHYIGGEWVRPRATFKDMNPATGQVYCNAPEANRIDVAAAVDAASAAFRPWAALPHTVRADYMLKIADIYERRRDEIVSHIVSEGGGWFGKGMFETGYVHGVWRAAAASCYEEVGELLPSDHLKVSMAVRRPMGVVSVISPWNFPMILSSRGMAFALAAGNTVVLKPSEETPVIGGLLFAEIFEEAGVPPGVLNVVTCSRDAVAEVGDELVSNPRVKGVSFTGSTPVGRKIAGRAGELLKSFCVELGGKNALLVFADADMDRSVQAANFGSFMHQGQICMSVDRLLVQDTIVDEFTRRFVEKAATLKKGDPAADKGNVIGPIINDRQVARIKDQLDDAVSKGAQVLLGGRVDGLFVEPTILTGVNDTMKIYREETFGPVTSIYPFSTEEEALRLANDSDYGLSAGVMTGDEERGLAMAAELETGMCHINCSPVNDEAMVPFGGAKGSGSGRHGGKWAINTFTETRWVTLERGHRHFPPVF
ncbi:MAG TPA: aldehyde dehydrogenase family protein [Devosiaceae bacterium]|nr:aldehyde dehydrogenase family protein [Devosiaceae bacterium]